MEEYAKVEALIDHTREYMQTRVDEAKLAVSEKATSVISLLVAGAAAAWLLLGCIAWMARNSIIRIPVMNALIHQLFKKEGADEKD